MSVIIKNFVRYTKLPNLRQNYVFPNVIRIYYRFNGYNLGITFNCNSIYRAMLALLTIFSTSRLSKVDKTEFQRSLSLAMSKTTIFTWVIPTYTYEFQEKWNVLRYRPQKINVTPSSIQCLKHLKLPRLKCWKEKD